MAQKVKSQIQKRGRVISARFTSQVYAILVDLAHREGLNISQILRKALREYVAEHA